MNSSPTARAAAIALLFATVLAVALTSMVARWLRTDSESAALDAARAMLRLVPMAEHDNDPVRDEVTALIAGRFSDIEHVYLARRQGSVVGMVAIVAEQGYGGPLRLLISADATGAVLGVHVLTQQETVGYGDRIVNERADWLLAFTGKRRGESVLRLRPDGGDVDAISGATVTSRAVVRAVDAALDAMQSARVARESSATGRYSTLPLCRK